MNAKELLDIELMKRIDRDIERLKTKKHLEQANISREIVLSKTAKSSHIKLDKLPRRKRERKNRCPKTYDAYINSVWWYRRKNQYYKTHPRMCEICNSSSFVDLHHTLYGNFGKELDENLIPLCREHHDMFHEYIGKTKKDMRKETHLFIEEQISLNLQKK